MKPLDVVHWKRYGQDRLYVNMPSGEQVGWFDLNTGKAMLERYELHSEFEAALIAFGVQPLQEHKPDPGTDCEDRPRTQPITSNTQMTEIACPQDIPSFAPQTTTQQLPWIDLAKNTAGEGIQERARELREATPIRSFLARLFDEHTDERAFRVGAAGEMKIGQRLTTLSDDWRVLHSVPVGSRGSDIDHVVIGPGGVFTINTKHHPDASIWVYHDVFKVNQHNQRYVPNARFEARRASNALTKTTGIGLTVTAIIAVVGAHKGFNVKAQPADGMVYVLGGKYLVPWLLRHAPILRADQVATIFEQARRSTTWL